MTCRVTVFDGTDTVVIEGVPEQTLDIEQIGGGDAIIRFIDGSSAKQTRWRKERYTIGGRGRAPQGLRDLDYSQQITLTVTTGLGTDVYTCWSLGPSEDWGLTEGTVSWTLELEAV